MDRPTDRLPITRDGHFRARENGKYGNDGSLGRAYGNKHDRRPTHLDIVDDRFAIGRRDGLFDGHDDVVVGARLEDGGTVGERDGACGGDNCRERGEFPHYFGGGVDCVGATTVFTDGTTTWPTGAKTNRNNSRNRMSRC